MFVRITYPTSRGVAIRQSLYRIPVILGTLRNAKCRVYLCKSHNIHGGIRNCFGRKSHCHVSAKSGVTGDIPPDATVGKIQHGGVTD